MIKKFLTFYLFVFIKFRYKRNLKIIQDRTTKMKYKNDRTTKMKLYRQLLENIYYIRRKGQIFNTIYLIKISIYCKNYNFLAISNQ